MTDLFVYQTDIEFFLHTQRNSGETRKFKKILQIDCRVRILKKKNSVRILFSSIQFGFSLKNIYQFLKKCTVFARICFINKGLNRFQNIIFDALRYFRDIMSISIQNSRIDFVQVHFD